MDTLTRIGTLRRRCGMDGFWPFEALHEVLDAVDKKVGIRTRHGCASAYVQGAKPFPTSEYVGARLARLERHVENVKNAMFWLGAGGEA